VCEIFLVARKTITRNQYKSSTCFLKTESEFVRWSTIAKKAQVSSSFTLFPPLSFEALALQILPTRFSARTMQSVSRHFADRYFNSLREHVYKISELLDSDMQIFVTDAELRSIVGRKNHGHEA
jgi:hypothetical protein